MAAAAAMTGKLTDVRKLLGRTSTTTSDAAPTKVMNALDFLTDETLPPPVPEGYKGTPQTSSADTPSSMPKFHIVKGIAAPLTIENVDTDMIIPKQFLKTIKRTGLKHALFHTLRKDPVTGADTDFILNRQPFDRASILVCTGANFGCGSSREHAPWSL
jgi:3-isopropylmalate dehydratase